MSDKKLVVQAPTFYRQDRHNLTLNTYHTLVGLNNHKSLSPQTISYFTDFNSKNSKSAAQQIKEFIEEEDQRTVDAFSDLIQKTCQDREVMKIMLPMFNAILIQSKKVVREFSRRVKANQKQVLTTLRSILISENRSVQQRESSANICSIYYGEGLQMVQSEGFCKTLITIHSQKRIKDYVFLISLNNLIKHSRIAALYFASEKVTRITQIAKTLAADTQLTYALLTSLWLISFLPQTRSYLCEPQQEVVEMLVEQCSKMQKEKLVRMSFKVFENLKGELDCIETMLDKGMIKIIDSLCKGFLKDEQLLKSMQSISELLQKNIRVLSSLDKYKKELRGEKFDWSSVHSQKFWKQHVLSFESQQFALIKSVIALLKSKNERTKAVACFDLGEFSRHYPFGKRVLQTLGGKEAVMILAKESDSREVREQALLALQKIMINNWEQI